MSNLKPFALECPMPASAVNLDAMIPREDFSSQDFRAGGRPRDGISITDLQSGEPFFNQLRKPDFQRETTHWSPNAVLDLIRAFLEGDLIPSVILWERGNETFVIDGAHRLSALIAWMRDDYGDGQYSSAKFGAGLSKEQRAVADRTRTAIRKEISSYAELKGLTGQKGIEPKKAEWVTMLGRGSIGIQWVTATTVKAAEASFFKINQAAQPIDPVERMILQTRTAPNAIAARCVARGGRGHKYWGAFELSKQEQIEALGQEIYELLFTPPEKKPTTTMDVPVAGQGYNVLPFIFYLVSLCNGLVIPATLTAKKLDSALPDDVSGDATIAFLVNVRKRLCNVTSNHPGSLGLHPLAYFYSKAGIFVPNAFLASLNFAKGLDSAKRKNDFTRVRADFEKYIYQNKIFVSLTVSRLGSGARSLNRIEDLYKEILAAFLDGRSGPDIYAHLVAQDKFKHLKQVDVPSPHFDELPSKRGASQDTKSASFIERGFDSVMRCPICNAAIHSNSMTFDHTARVREGGDNQSQNLAPVHPYCNSGFKG